MIGTNPARVLLDDRGEIREVVNDPRKSAEKWASIDPASSMHIEASAREQGVGELMFAAGEFGAGIVPVIAFLVAWGVVEHFGLSGMPAIIVAIVAAAPVLGAMMWVRSMVSNARSRWRAAQGTRSRAQVRAIRTCIAHHNACPACAYPLSGLEPEKDACVVCSECGGAWRRDLWRNDGGMYVPRAKLIQAGWVGGRIAVRDARGIGIEIVAWERRRIRRRLVRAAAGRPGVAEFGVFVLVCALYFGTVGLLAALMFMATAVLPSAIAAGVAALALAHPAWTLSRRLAFQRGCRTLARGFVADGVCPACKGAIRDEPSFSDGSLLCRACGAAWEIRDHPGESVGSGRN